jgi:hypothetical protein
MACLAQPSPVSWVVVVHAVGHEVASAQWVVVCHCAGREAPGSVVVCGVCAHAQWVSTQYPGTEAVGVCRAVATLAGRASALLGLGLASVAPARTCRYEVGAAWG